jgi:AmmeMemoRadiSam system protein B/AmmeMemoRadiSam system protein A
MGAIRPAAVAGQFYPGTAHELTTTVETLLGDAAARIDADAPTPKAVIAPHAGYVYSGAVAASAYARLKPAADTITRIVLIGPCHRVPVRGFAVSSADAFRTPLGDIAVDTDLRARALALDGVAVFDATHAQEHALEVHLPFLQRLFPKAKVLPMVVGDATPDAVAAVLEALWGGPETLIVISSDLSHYLDYDTATAIDRKTCDAIEALDGAAIGRDQACGRVPVKGLLALAKRRGMAVETVDLRNSGDTAGPRGRVVGYGSWVFTETVADDGTPPAPGKPSAARTASVTIDPKTRRVVRAAPKPPPQPPAASADDFEARTKSLLARFGTTLLDLAAASIRYGLKAGKPIRADIDTFPADLRAPGASFVTLKKRGQLRGCIGSPQAHRPLVEDVAVNAFSAAFKDPRFPALTAAETDGLDLSISVLSPASAMAIADEADLLAQLRPGVDGLIIHDGGRRALFLPSVWEQLPDPKTFLAHLKRKARMAPDHWSATFAAERFIAEEVSSKSLEDPARLWRDRG